MINGAPSSFEVLPVLGKFISNVLLSCTLSQAVLCAGCDIHLAMSCGQGGPRLVRISVQLTQIWCLPPPPGPVSSQQTPGTGCGGGGPARARGIILHWFCIRNTNCTILILEELKREEVTGKVWSLSKGKRQTKWRIHCYSFISKLILYDIKNKGDSE